MVGCVGEDDFGNTLRHALAEDGIATANVRSVAGGTGVAVVMVDDAGENRITIIPGANALLKADAQALAGKYLLLQCEVPMPEVVLAARIMRAKGSTVVLNPAPVCQLPDELWWLVDILVMNEMEASELSGLPVADPATAAAAATSLRRRGPSTAIVTLGSQGVLVADDAGCRHFPAREAHVVDTTAAGDTFIGAMCAARVAGLSIDDAVLRGIQAATVCVTRAGAQASIPYLHELAAP
jgi:ribokinase